MANPVTIEWEKRKEDRAPGSFPLPEEKEEEREDAGGPENEKEDGAGRELRKKAWAIAQQLTEDAPSKLNDRLAGFILLLEEHWLGVDRARLQGEHVGKLVVRALPARPRLKSSAEDTGIGARERGIFDYRALWNGYVSAVWGVVGKTEDGKLSVSSCWELTEGEASGSVSIDPDMGTFRVKDLGWFGFDRTSCFSVKPGGGLDDQNWIVIDSPRLYAMLDNKKTVYKAYDGYVGDRRKELGFKIQDSDWVALKNKLAAVSLPSPQPPHP
jgi:hypothetical protein